MDIVQQRCFNHGSREAAARCPECRRHFCRECVTEHEDRLLCASCQRLRTTEGGKADLRPGLQLIAALISFLMLVFGFYLTGRLLGAFPERGYGGDPFGFHPHGD